MTNEKCDEKKKPKKHLKKYNNRVLCTIHTFYAIISAN